MKNTLILHGFGATPNSNWFPWLRQELEFKAEGVYLPALPNTSEPVLEDQLAYLYAYASDFSDGGNIVGHSLGGLLALHFALENDIKNSNIVLVAPAYNGIGDEVGEDVFGAGLSFLKTYTDIKIDIEKLNKLNNRVVILISDDDPFIKPESVEKKYGSIENVEIRMFKGKGHLNEGTGYFSFPEILEYID